MVVHLLVFMRSGLAQHPVLEGLHHKFRRPLVLLASMFMLPSGLLVGRSSTTYQKRLAEILCKYSSSHHRKIDVTISKFKWKYSPSEFENVRHLAMFEKNRGKFDAAYGFVYNQLPTSHRVAVIKNRYKSKLLRFE